MLQLSLSKCSEHSIYVAQCKVIHLHAVLIEFNKVCSSVHQSMIHAVGFICCTLLINEALYSGDDVGSYELVE
jgi:hypothetical protein